MVRLPAIAALIGRPGALASLKTHFRCGQADAQLASAIASSCRSHVFFRGGQAHGSLKKASAGTATSSFCRYRLDALAAACSQWGVSARHAGRAESVRSVVHLLGVCAQGFGARHYWSKRFMDVMLLCAVACPGISLLRRRTLTPWLTSGPWAQEPEQGCVGSSQPPVATTSPGRRCVCCSVA